MVDAAALIKAARLGYEFTCDEKGDHYYRKCDDREQSFGPFKNRDDAAYSAIGQYETQLAFGFLDKIGIDK